MGLTLGIMIVLFLISFNDFPLVVVWVMRLCCVLMVIGCVIAYMNDRRYKKEKREREEPRQWNYNTRGEYERALKEWKKLQEPPLQSLSLGARLVKRNYKHDTTSNNEFCGIKCSICGSVKNYEQAYCAECLELYERSPKEPMPDGISEKHRMMLWAVRQSIIVDYMDGKIDEETARREANEAIEYVKSVIQQREQIEKQHLEIKLKHAKSLEQRLVYAERLTQK